ELVRPEQPVAPDGRVLGGHGLERPAAEIAREDDVDDVLRGEGPSRSDRVDDRDRSLERKLVGDPDLLAELAVQRPDQALTGVHAPAGEEPVLAPGLLVPAKEDPSSPAQDRRDPDAGLDRHHAAEEPNPRTPRS